MAGVVVGIARPNETVIGHLVPFFACDFAGFATDAHSWISEETNLNVVLHVACAGADLYCVCLRRSRDHWSSGVMEDWSDTICDSRTTFHCSITRTLHYFIPRVHSFPSIAWPPPLCPFRKDRSSGCKIVGPPCGAYLLRNSANAGPRGRRPGTMLQVSALASMMVTLGSPEMVRRSFAALPWTKPAVPK